MPAFVVKSISKQVLRLLTTCLLLLALIMPAASHRYFFGVSDLSVNVRTQQIEIIHQFTVHDIENAIAEIKQIHFSPEHEKYDAYIQEYIEHGFELKYNNTLVKLVWLGFEIKSGKIIAYQESMSKSQQSIFLAELVIKNTILIDVYPRQVNTVNFQGNNKQGKDHSGSITFDNNINIIQIKAEAKSRTKVTQ